MSVPLRTALWRDLADYRLFSIEGVGLGASLP
jgi:hypothetical protein